MLGDKRKDLAPRPADAHDARPCWAEISHGRRLLLMTRGEPAPRAADAHDVPTILGQKCQDLAPRAADACAAVLGRDFTRKAADAHDARPFRVKS